MSKWDYGGCRGEQTSSRRTGKLSQISQFAFRVISDLNPLLQP